MRSCNFGRARHHRRRLRQRSIRQVPTAEWLAEQERRPETARNEGQGRAAPRRKESGEKGGTVDINIGVGELQDGKGQPKLKSR